MSAYEKLKKINSFNNLTRSSQSLIVFGEAFPKISKSINALTDTFAQAAPEIGKFKASFKSLGAAMKANPVGAVIAGITALIAVIKIADYALDKANKSTEELIEEGNNINERIAQIQSELSDVNKEIDELKDKKLTITDPEDISRLEKQIELIEKRREYLEASEKVKQNERKYNAQEALWYRAS